VSDSPFANVPVEAGTRIVSSRETTFDNWPVLHQAWTWEGILAESLIFLAIEVAHLGRPGAGAYGGSVTHGEAR